MIKNSKIKKSCHTEFISVSRIFCNKRGAMFGLDARIALAIFVALSIITGVALYGVLGKIEIISIITETKEIHKAIEQYYIDTGKNLPNNTVTNYEYLIELDYLINDKGIKNWKGPYINLELKSNHSFVNKYFNHSTLDPKGWWNIDRVEVSGGYNVSRTQGCSSGEGCYYATRMSYVPKDVAFEIDKKIDGSVDGNSGDVRHWYISAGSAAGTYDMAIIGPRVF